MHCSLNQLAALHAESTGDFVVQVTMEYHVSALKGCECRFCQDAAQDDETVWPHAHLLSWLLTAKQGSDPLPIRL